MHASSEWKGGTQYEGGSESGHALLFDTDAAHSAGPSPMEAVLAALCACTSVEYSCEEAAAALVAGGDGQSRAALGGAACVHENSPDVPGRWAGTQSQSCGGRGGFIKGQVLLGVADAAELCRVFVFHRVRLELL
jgi:hypothetical protein